MLPYGSPFSPTGPARPCAPGSGSKNGTRLVAKRAGPAVGSGPDTLKLFELTGKIAVTRLLLIAAALGCLGEFEVLFKPQPASSLADLERAAGLRRRLPNR